MKKIITLLYFLSASLVCFSQQVDMADELRASGKIYVVVGVLVTILLGILLFLIAIDRKIGRLGKKINKK